MLILNVVQEKDQVKYDDLIKLIESQDLNVLAQYAMGNALYKLATKFGIEDQLNNNNGDTALIATLTMNDDKPLVQEHLFSIKQVVV